MERYQLSIAAICSVLHSALRRCNLYLRQRGQGLVEYGLILILVSVASVAIISGLAPILNDNYEQVRCAVSGGTWHQDQGKGKSTKCK